MAAPLSADEIAERLKMRLHTLEVFGMARTVRTAGGHLGAQFRTSGYRFMMDLNFYIHALKHQVTPHPATMLGHSEGHIHRHSL